MSTPDSHENSVLTVINPDDTPDKFLVGHVGNPFARINCKTIHERMCQGICPPCEKARIKYSEKRLLYWKEYFKKQEIVLGGDPDPFEDTPEMKVEKEIKEVTFIKSKIYNIKRFCNFIENRVKKLTLH